MDTLLLGRYYVRRFVQSYERFPFKKLVYFPLACCMGVVHGRWRYDQRMEEGDLAGYTIVTEYHVPERTAADTAEFETRWNKLAKVAQKFKGYESTKLYKPVQPQSARVASGSSASGSLRVRQLESEGEGRSLAVRSHSGECSSWQPADKSRPGGLDRSRKCEAIASNEHRRGGDQSSRYDSAGPIMTSAANPTSRAQTAAPSSTSSEDVSLPLAQCQPSVDHEGEEPRGTLAKLRRLLSPSRRRRVSDVNADEVRRNPSRHLFVYHADTAHETPSTSCENTKVFGDRSAIYGSPTFSPTCPAPHDHSSAAKPLAASPVLLVNRLLQHQQSLSLPDNNTIDLTSAHSSVQTKERGAGTNQRVIMTLVGSNFKNGQFFLDLLDRAKSVYTHLSARSRSAGAAATAVGTSREVGAQRAEEDPQVGYSALASGREASKCIYMEVRTWRYEEDFLQFFEKTRHLTERLFLHRKGDWPVGCCAAPLRAAAYTTVVDDSDNRVIE